jgi:hypothetical protein
MDERKQGMEDESAQEAYDPLNEEKERISRTKDGFGHDVNHQTFWNNFTLHFLSSSPGPRNPA